MKLLRNILILAASVTYVACVKVQSYYPDNDKEIVFNVFAKNPIVTSKAAFPTTRPFRATAFMLPAGKTWDADKETSILYIDDALIAYEGFQWHCPAKPYYWPKQSSLSFMAYAPSDIGASCSRENGVELIDYNIYNPVSNRTKDFMVADIAKDKNANENIYGYNGVPTLFRHKLSAVYFKAKLNTEPDVPTDIRITKVGMRYIYTVGSYTKDKWINLSAPKTYESITEGTFDLQLTTEAKWLIEQDLYVLPQHMYTAPDRPSPPEIYIEGTWNGSPMSKSFVVNTVSEEWKTGTMIIYTLSFSVKDEYIEFDADVMPWEDTSSSDIQIGL